MSDLNFELSLASYLPDPENTKEIKQNYTTEHNAKDPNNLLSELTIWMKYARYIRDKQRRETWVEICNRNRQMHLDKYPQLTGEINEIYDNLVIPKKVLPSMRSMQFAGAAISQHNSRMFNCAYAPVDSVESFGEIMFLLLGGTGIGYSVQQRHISKLPKIGKPKTKTLKLHVKDNIEGWGDAVKALLYSYFGDTIYSPEFDLSDIRPKGAELVTSGGKAPGPEPLRICLDRIENILRSKQEGQQLSDIDVHDIVCHIADAVYAGGIRRAALISLFDRDSEAMLSSKSSAVPSEIVGIQKIGGVDYEGEKHSWVVDVVQNGIRYNGVELQVDDNGHSYDYGQFEEHGTMGWWVCNGQRQRANNSAVLPRGEVSEQEFQHIWKKIQDSGSGEPGVYWTDDQDWGTNPCVETALRPYQFCNLVEINASSIENHEDARYRVWGAAVLGTLQAGYTDFNYLRPCWKESTDKDALLGVSMTGLASRKIEQLGLNLSGLAAHARLTNEFIANKIGIQPSARVTCIKPAGTTSLTLGTSSGIHPWHDQFYIRRIRVNKNEAIYHHLLSVCPGIVEDAKSDKSGNTAVIAFPQRAPENALIREHEAALEMLERIKAVYTEWVLGGHSDGINTHNISATVNIKPGEWDGVGDWMWQNKSYYNGISVLPYDGGTYVQAPFETITEQKYNEMRSLVGDLDFSTIIEIEDQTDLVHEVACAGGVCEL